MEEENVVKFPAGEPGAPLPSRGDRRLAVLIILTRVGVAVVYAVIYLLAAIGAVSLVR